MAIEIRILGFTELDAHAAHSVWKLRQDVFVVEQECPYPDLDGRDPEPGTRHVLVLEDGTLVGYLRILDDSGASGPLARVGRVVLDRSVRGRGLADAMMEAALTEIGDRPSVLDAQAPLADWYARFGYTVSGPAFVEDGIEHLPMRR